MEKRFGVPINSEYQCHSLVHTSKFRDFKVRGMSPIKYRLQPLSSLLLLYFCLSLRLKTAQRKPKTGRLDKKSNR